MILITGAAGFIGSALAAALNRRGHNDLILVDALGTGAKWKNLLGLQFKDFINRESLFDVIGGAKWAEEVDLVLHMGARTDTIETDVDMLHQLNTEFTQALCHWALTVGARFVYASSAAVYGDGFSGFSDGAELTPRLRPLNPYGFSKWLTDMWMLENGLLEEVLGLRFFNVFGPNEYHKGRMASVVHNAFPTARREGRVSLFKSHREDFSHGEQTRDFIYIDELVEAVLFLIENEEACGFCNIGTGRGHTFNQLANALLKGVDKEPEIEYIPMPEDLRDTYQYRTVADISSLKSYGFKGFEDRFEDNVVRYVERFLLPGKYYQQG